MKSILKSSLLLAGALLMLDGAAARAVDFREMYVNVPFPFVVEHKVLPAGQYLLQRDDTSGSLLLIRKESSKHATGSFILTNTAAGRDPSGDKPCLTFTKKEGQYQLTNIWESRGEGLTVLGANSAPAEPNRGN